MTLKDFTEGENQKTIVVLSCSAEFTAEVQGELIFLSIVNIFLSIAAVLGNTLILVALHKETSLHPPSKLKKTTKKQQTNFIENWKITNYITFPPANSL